MNTCIRTVLVGTLSLAAAAGAQAIVFDATLGLPAAQGWTTLSIGAAGIQSVSGNTFTTDSTGVGVDTWGYSLFSPAPLDPVVGYTVNFGLRVPQESHANDNRAGFSMLFVGSTPSQSIELAFRTGEVMAYQYVNGAFELNYRAAFNVFSSQQMYTLNVANGGWSLSAMGNVLINGPLQNYTPQGLPYNLANFVFFGDNTSSGSAVAEVTFIDVLPAPVPEPGLAAIFLAGLGVVVVRARQQRAQALQSLL